ncbi:MAG: glutaredoxin family protein [Candidatus Koribacter versatilis]|nr:glutaredoxin family protein [Candidatus Koribacter versatilis]
MEHREVIVYSRKGCHLCEIVKESLVKLHKRTSTPTPSSAASTTIRFQSSLSTATKLSSTAWMSRNFSKS